MTLGTKGGNRLPPFRKPCLADAMTREEDRTKLETEKSMIMGGRRSREAKEQSERLRNAPTMPQPRIPPLARLIMNSKAFKRLMERLDTREGAGPEHGRPQRQPAPANPSDRVLPEKGSYVPRMHPLGGLVYRTRFVQRLLGSPFDRTAAPASGDRCTSANGRADESEEDRSQAHESDSCNATRSVACGPDTPLSDTEIREMRHKALISSLQHSASRWSGR